MEKLKRRIKVGVVVFLGIGVKGVEYSPLRLALLSPEFEYLIRVNTNDADPALTAGFPSADYHLWKLFVELY